MMPNSVSFVLPMYNEADNISATVSGLTRIVSGITGDYEIIIVDDGSTDKSWDLVQEISRRDRHVLGVRLPKNTKFGGALRKGLEKAKNDIIIYTDSDLPLEEEEIKRAIPLIKEADIVNAYSSVRKGENLKRIIMSKGYNFLVKLLFNPKIRDINSGFKIYKRGVFDGMKLCSESPFIDVEIFVNAKRKGFTIKEYPVIFKHRKQGRSYISRPAVIIKTFLDMLRFKLSDGRVNEKTYNKRG